MPKNKNGFAASILTCLITALYVPFAGAADTAKTVASQPNRVAPITLSSAKTIKQLLETDDAIAIAKERNLLTDELKKNMKDVDDPNAAAEQKAASAKSAAENKIAEQRAAKALSSTINISSIVGLQGQRIVSASVGGKLATLRESESTAFNGWKLMQVQGACAVFERVEVTSTKKPSKVASRSTRTPSELVNQTVCFSRPVPVTQMAAAGSSQGAGVIPVPIPSTAALAAQMRSAQMAQGVNAQTPRTGLSPSTN